MPTFYSAQQQAAPTDLNSLYQKYYQRDATPEEAAAHAGNPGGLPAVEKMLQDATGGSGGPVGGDFKSWFMKLTGGKPPTPDMLTQLGPELAKYGVTLAPNAQGVNGKIKLPNGQVIDVIEAAGAGGKNWQWLEGGGGGNGNMARFLDNSGQGFTPATGPTTPAPGDYKVDPYTGQPLPTYNPTILDKPADFTSPLTNPTSDLIQRLLSSEGSLNPAVVAQMKEAQKGTALSMADQLKQQANVNAATRGVSGGGGLQSSIDDINARAVGDISAGYRGTDIAAAQTNRQDQLNAISASTGFQNQLLNQYLGQGAQNLNYGQANNAERYKGFQSEQAKSADEFQRYLSSNQLGLTANDQAFQHWAAQQGIQLNFQNAQMLADQFNRTYGLNVGRFLAGE